MYNLKKAYTSTVEEGRNSNSANYFLDRFGFKELLQASVDVNDPTQTVANLFTYYIDGRVLSNIIEALFARADTNQRSTITSDQYFTITDDEGVHRLDAQRALYLVKSDPAENTLDFYEFSNLAEVLLHESLSIVAFTYIVGGPQHSDEVKIDLQTLENKLLEIFGKVPAVYPKPRCEELEYLFQQSDINEDARLDIQEFHYLLSIFLRYYKSGVQNNKYASLVFNDEMYQQIWEKESGLGGHLGKTKFLRLSFLRFLQVSIYDKILNQVSHVLFTKFDTNGNGVIDRDEFARLIKLFRAPDNEVELLFATADTDKSGSIDFAEFVVTLETFLRRLIADFGYYFIVESHQNPNVDASYQLLQNATGYLNLEFLPKDKFTDIFNGVDANKDLNLDKDEFATFTSEIIAFLRTKIRLEEEADITSVAGLNATASTIAQTKVIREQGYSERANEVTSDLLADEQSVSNEIVRALTAGTAYSETEGLNDEELEQAERMTEAIDKVFSYQGPPSILGGANQAQNTATPTVAQEISTETIASAINSALLSPTVAPVQPTEAQTGAAEGTLEVAVETTTTTETATTEGGAATTTEATTVEGTTEAATEATEGAATEGETEGAATEGATEGAATEGATEGAATEGATEGAATEGATEGAATEGATEGAATEGATEGTEATALIEIESFKRGGDRKNSLRSTL